MSLERLPALVVALSLSAYWASVIILGFRLRRKIGKGPNSLPSDPVGLLMRLLWIPAIILQVLHSWRIAVGFTRGFAFITPYIVLPWGQPPEPPLWWTVASALAALVVVFCLSLTFICWRKMGKSWRIGIDPGEKLELVSSGPYRLVRHPIYALRIMLDACAIVAVPTVFMAVVTGIDMLMLAIEARREEHYMEATHGAVYADYKKRVGRFVPRAIRT